MSQFIIMDVNNIIIILIDLISVFLALWVLLANPRKKANRGFFLMVISILSWITFYHFASSLQYRTISQTLFRLANGSVFLFFITYYFFIVRWFLNKEKIFKILGRLVLVYGLVFGAVTIFSNLIITSPKFNSWGAFPLFSSWGWFVFYGHVIFLTTLINILLIKSYSVSPQEKKLKIQYFLTGLIIFALSNLVFNVILPVFFNNYKLYFLGNYSTIFLIGFTAYAIMKHQLFDIKVITTETIVIALSTGLLIEVLLSNNATEGLLKGIVWVLASYGGYALVKSVKTEIKQKEKLGILAKKLQEANEHLNELDETKDNFLSMAAHELNTPIAAINGYLSMILDEKLCGHVNKEVSKYLNQIYGSSRRLANLVKDLLNVSRIESNRIHIIYGEAQIEDIIEQSVAEVAIKAKEAGHTLTFDKPKHKLPKSWMDVARITEVLINFMGNSIKYTDPPGKIVVRVHADDGKIVAAVEDNGRGIPKDKQDHVFEKFTQVNVLKDEVKGTGLGMFISKNLIEMHKGKIWFKSSVDQDDHGSIFYFSIPILKNKPYDPHEGEGALFALKPTSTESTEDLKKELAQTLGEKEEVKKDTVETPNKEEASAEKTVAEPDDKDKTDTKNDSKVQEKKISKDIKKVEVK